MCFSVTTTFNTTKIVITPANIRIFLDSVTMTILFFLNKTKKTDSNVFQRQNQSVNKIIRISTLLPKIISIDIIFCGLQKQFTTKVTKGIQKRVMKIDCGIIL